MTAVDGWVDAARGSESEGKDRARERGIMH